MAIHYENYARFSKGQGFIGSACRPLSAQAKTARWTASDCGKCKATLLDRVVISRGGNVGKIVTVTSSGVVIGMITSPIAPISFDDLDKDWAPFPSTEEIFGVKE